MQRFFAIAILLNWLIAIAFIGVVGFSDDFGGLMQAMQTMLEGEGGVLLDTGLARSITIGATLAVATAGLWSLLTIIFVGLGDADATDQEFVVTTAMGACLVVFTIILTVSIWLGSAEVGALASIASFATVLAAVAHRVCAIENTTEEMTSSEPAALSMMRATSMANQSATLASLGARTTRFVPKRPYT